MRVSQEILPSPQFFLPRQKLHSTPLLHNRTLPLAPPPPPPPPPPPHRAQLGGSLRDLELETISNTPFYGPEPTKQTCTQSAWADEV